MKLVCLQENLKNSLSIIERGVGQNATLPILSSILLSANNNQLKLSATNLEISITTWIPCKIEEKGEVCIQSKVLSGFVNNITNGKIDIELDNNVLKIKKDDYKANILTTDPKNFPIIPKVKNEENIKIKQKDLKNGVVKVINSASISDLKPEITGINFNFKKNILKIAATDSFRLAENQIILEKNVNEERNFILPQKTAQELSRLLKDSDENADLIIDKNQIIIEFNNIQIYSKLIDGHYPDYNQIIPKSFETVLSIKKSEFLNTIKLASVFCGKTNDIKMSIKNNNLEITSQDLEKGENKNLIKTDKKGPDLDTVFNYKYLIDGLNNIEDEEIIFSLNEKNTPVMFYGKNNKKYIYLVMPIRSV